MTFGVATESVRRYPLAKMKAPGGKADVVRELSSPSIECALYALVLLQDSSFVQKAFNERSPNNFVSADQSSRTNCYVRTLFYLSYVLSLAPAFCGET
jgi:hypothetical protein